MSYKVTIKKNSDGTITRSVNGANSDQASNITTSKGTTVQTEIESITPYTKVTQAQYDALKSAGTLAKNTNYIITDKPYSADDVLDLATIKSRGASGTLKASDVASASALYGSLKWNLHQTVSGTTNIVLPSDYEELIVKLYYAGNSFSIHFAKIELETSQSAYWFGGYRTTTSNVGGYINIGQSSCALATAFEGGTNYTSNAQVSVYYR